MAEPVIRMKGLMARAALIGALALAAWPTAAQELPDPTRPPSTSGAAGEIDAGPVLQSVLISPQRKAAIISGKEVPLHGYYGKARLIRVSETEVVLRDGNTLQKLKLFPAIEKQKAKPARTQDNG